MIYTQTNSTSFFFFFSTRYSYTLITNGVSSFIFAYMTPQVWRLKFHIVPHLCCIVPVPDQSPDLFLFAVYNFPSHTSRTVSLPSLFLPGGLSLTFIVLAKVCIP